MSLFFRPMLRSFLLLALLLLGWFLLLMSQINQLAPAYQEKAMLVEFIALFCMAVLFSVLAACHLFYKNRQHPKIKVSAARWRYALLAFFVPMVIFGILIWLRSMSYAACLSGNLFAVVADPANAAVCLHIKSLLLTKFLGFMSPAFMGQLLATTFFVGLWSGLIYLLLTMRVIYQNDR